MIEIMKEKIHKFNNPDDYEAAIDSGTIGEFDYSLIEDESEFNIDGYCKAKTYQTALKKLHKAAVSAGANPDVLSLDDIMYNIDQAIRKRNKDLKQHYKKQDQDRIYAMLHPYPPSSKGHANNPNDGYSMGIDGYGYEETWWQKDPDTGERYFLRLNLEPVDDGKFYVDLGYSKKAF